MKKKFIITTVLTVFSVFSSGCGDFALAPLKDGSYLKYEFRSKEFTGSCKIVFNEISATYFEVSVEDPQGLLGRPFARPGRDGKVLVNRMMKRRGGRPLEFDELGPVWVPPATRRKGGRAGIDMVFSGTFEDKIADWKKWKVYAVEATIFRGAFSGTWYYDTTTGFLVGHEKKTVATSFFTKTPPYWILTGSNIEGLMKGKPAAPAQKAGETAKGPAESRDKKTVIFKNGGVIEGYIARQTENSITLEFEGGSTMIINKEDVRAIK
ncbi:MAG: hypothetical protein PVH45_01425 [Candidatus Omnitrophota bacterium]